MLTLTVKLIKISAFSILLLIIANWISLNGKTVAQYAKTTSDEIKIHFSKAENLDAVKKIQKSTETWLDDAKKGANQILENPGTSEKSPTQGVENQDRISISERQKLRSLIKELNQNR